MIMQSFWVEYLVIMVPFIMGLIGPGPDFVMIIRNSATGTRQSGVFTALGLGCGVLTHASYTIFGLGMILAQHPEVINGIKYCGATYITYIGIRALMSKKQTSSDIDLKGAPATTMTPFQAFRVGYFTQILNPHAATFILSMLLSVQLSPLSWRMSYGLSMCISAVIWYSAISIFLTDRRLRQAFLRVGHIINWVAGVVLIGLAIRLVLTKVEVALPVAG
ncbi:MAG: LysE family translocator [Alphaproteobacteria bacterium]|nr:LysE family translocator [Alphaproteobacteria bacterium]